jgi:hypothetical protein
MNQFFQFKISCLILTTYLVALGVVKDLTLLTFVLLIQPVLIWTVVSLLCMGIPKSIRQAAKHNSYRVDGSKSSRRESRERRAEIKVRTTMYVVLIYVALVGDWLFLFFYDKPNSLVSEGNLSIIPVLPFLVWSTLGAIVIGYSYLRILKAYHAGIQSRSEEYVDRDMVRLQS